MVRPSFPAICSATKALFSKRTIEPDPARPVSEEIDDAIVGWITQKAIVQHVIQTAHIVRQRPYPCQCRVTHAS